MFGEAHDRPMATTQAGTSPNAGGVSVTRRETERMVDSMESQWRELDEINTRLAGIVLRLYGPQVEGVDPDQKGREYADAFVDQVARYADNTASTLIDIRSKLERLESF